MQPPAGAPPQTTHYGSVRLTGPSAHGAGATAREFAIGRREADLAQREAELSRLEEHVRHRPTPLPGSARARSLAARRQLLAAATSGSMPLGGLALGDDDDPLLLWHCWSATCATLLWNSLCEVARWALEFIEGRELLLSGVILVALPTCAWLGWYSPISLAARHGAQLPLARAAPARELPSAGELVDGPWLAGAALGGHALIALLGAIGPPGCGMPGAVVALVMAEQGARPPTATRRTHLNALPDRARRRVPASRGGRGRRDQLGRHRPALLLDPPSRPPPRPARRHAPWRIWPADRHQGRRSVPANPGPQGQGGSRRPDS